MILIDTREQKQDYIQRFLQRVDIDAQICTLSHGMDYLITGKYDSLGIQRKDFTEVATQMEHIRTDIVPALCDLTDNPVLLIEETFSITQSGMIMRKEGNFLKESGITANMYFAFLHSITKAGCRVVTTRNLDATCWWFASTHLYVQKEHYPKPYKKYSTDMQAVGMLCCINNFGITKSKKLLQEYSIAELLTMPEMQLRKMLTENQYINFKKVLGVKLHDAKES